MELRTAGFTWKIGCCLIFYLILCVFAEENTLKEPKPRDRKIGKDVRDMTDADLEHLLDQWEQDEEPLEPDELPEHLRPQPNIDFSKLDMSNPDNVLKVSKKGKSLMMFVDVNPELSEKEASDILKIWQTSLHNNHIIAERYPIEPKREIFMFRDGAQAVDAKNYLLEQPELSHVTLEGQHHVGRYASSDITKNLNRFQPAASDKEVKKNKNTEL